MNILFITPYIPSRIRVRPFHLITELSKEHNVHVIALGEAGKTDCEGVKEVKNAARSCQIVPHSRMCGYLQSLLALPTLRPMCTSFCRSVAMQREVEQTMANIHFDVVHIEHLRAAHFAPSPREVPVVFDSVDCLTGLFRQMARAKKNLLKKLIMLEEAACLSHYEPRILKRFDCIAVTSDSERKEIRTLDRELDAEVIPNGVDTGYFAPNGSAKSSARFVFSGKMSYYPNVQAALWFAENVFRHLRRVHSEAEFIIAGSDPPAAVKALSDIPGVTVTGYVHDIRQYIDRSAIAVAPMQVAVGIQNKALEAMAMGLPVLATSAAARALGPGCPGVILADSVEEMRKHASYLIRNHNIALKIGMEGREHTMRHFSWQSSVAKLERLYEEAMEVRRTPANRISSITAFEGVS